MENYRPLRKSARHLLHIIARHLLLHVVWDVAALHIALYYIIAVVIIRHVAVYHATIIVLLRVRAHHTSI